MGSALTFIRALVDARASQSLLRSAPSPQYREGSDITKLVCSVLRL